MVQRNQHLSFGEICYQTWGQGTPILCLHGLADHGLVWRSLGLFLSKEFLCIAPDLPGHGNSVKPDIQSAYVSTQLVLALEEWAEANQWSNLTIIAHSWAAKLALMWANKNPQLVQQLILVDPFFVNRFPGLLKPTLPLLYRTLPFLKMLGPFSTAHDAELTAKTLKQYQGWSDLQQAVFQESIEKKQDGRWGSKFAIAARNGVFLDTFQVSGLTETIHIPTYLLLPKLGLNRRPWQLKPYNTFIPNLSIQHIPGNHWPHLVEPEDFNRTILEILKGR